MTAKIIDGKETAREMRENIKQRVSELKARGTTPGLTVILVGEDPASQVYVRNKEKGCQEVGINSTVVRLPASTSQEELLDLIDRMNGDSSVHGILVQLPLPDHIDEQTVIRAIAVEKDVDGFSPENMGRLLLGLEGTVSCTPLGCLALLDRYGIELKGKKAVVVGRSNIVGKPMAHLLLQRHATVCLCHSRTPDLKTETIQADVLVVAVGKAGLITGDMIKPGAAVIDVGTNRMEDGSLAGDVDFVSAREVAGWISPVPGGVGPMTITMLLHNTVEAAARGV